jgi:hypothetical protein
MGTCAVSPRLAWALSFEVKSNDFKLAKMEINAEKKPAAQTYYRRWLIRAPLGLVLVGFGACLIAESAMMKYAGLETWKWVLAGTCSLCVFNAGLSIFGDAILQRVRYERYT